MSRAAAPRPGGNVYPTFPSPASSFRPPTQLREEKFGAGETAWKASSSSLVINLVRSGRYPNPKSSLPDWRKKQTLPAPHPLPGTSSPGDPRAWGSVASLCLLKPSGLYCPVQPDLGDCLLWASASPSVNARALKQQTVTSVVGFSQALNTQGNVPLRLRRRKGTRHCGREGGPCVCTPRLLSVTRTLPAAQGSLPLSPAVRQVVSAQRPSQAYPTPRSPSSPLACPPSWASLCVHSLPPLPLREMGFVVAGESLPLSAPHSRGKSSFPTCHYLPRPRSGLEQE